MSIFISETQTVLKHHWHLINQQNHNRYIGLLVGHQLPQHINRSVSFAFWCVACDRCAVWWQSEGPRFWRMLFAHQESPGPLQASLRRLSQTILSWPRGTLPPGETSSFSIWHLLSWGVKKGGNDRCKAASLEDFMLEEYLYCDGTELCQLQLVQSWHKRQWPMVTAP